MILPATPRRRPTRRRAWPGRAAGLLLAGAAFCLSTGVQAVESLRIAAARAPVSLPLFVAQQRGYFADEGLAVSIEDCIGGTRCIRCVLEGRADVATSSEMPVVLRSFVDADVVVIATMVAASDNLKLVARRASGVVRTEQLAGRHVGVIAGTAAQYLLETHLLSAGIDPNHVTMVPLQAEDTIEALRSGRIDAVAVWEPYGYQALHADAGEPVGLRLPLSSGYIENYNLVVRRAAVGVRDTAFIKLLRAVDRAERFIVAHPAEAQAVLRERLQLDDRFVAWVWNGLAYRLSLDQSLLTTMESEIHWAQREGHAPGGRRPDVLALVYSGPLKSFKPAAVGTGN